MSLETHSKETSTSFSLEIAKYLMLEHDTQNTDIAEYYVFDIGELMIGDVKANIISLEDYKVRIVKNNCIR